MPELFTGVTALMAFDLGSGLVAALNDSFSDVLAAENGPFTVWLMGGDAELSLALERALPEQATVGVINGRLDTAADSLETGLLNIDTQVLVDESDRLAWSASLLGDRSQYAGELQINAARYVAMNGIVRGGGRHVFFVEDGVTAQAFEATAILNGLPVKSYDGIEAKPKILKVIRSRLSAIKTVLQCRRMLGKLRRGRSVRWGDLQACDVLILDWAGTKSFKEDGSVERFGNLERLPEILRDAGLKIGFIANPLSWTQPFSDIARNVVKAYDPVVMIDDCRSLGSVLRSAMATWKMSRNLKKTVHLGGFDLSALFELERIRDIYKPQSTLAMAVAEVARVLAEHGVKPKAIVYPFENHGWERALIWGIRHYLPETRVVAFQQSPFARRWIGFFSPASDFSNGLVADHIVVMGPLFAEWFKNHGWPAECITVGGSLRFEYALATPPEPICEKSATVLAATSIDINEALDLVRKAGKAIVGLDGVRLMVNFHPVVDDDFRKRVGMELVQAVGDSAMDRVELSNARVSELIHDTAVLIYNNSGAVFDACFVGTPSLYVCIDGRINMDKAAEGVSRCVVGAADLKETLRGILSMTSNQEPDFSVGGMIAPVSSQSIYKAVRGL